ncbi:Mak16 protein [Ostreococcus tauri]|uniref:Protein MAK16 homolog n=1 Tax=Ostreococcus tauri TaxID=70448 RepID=A0A090M7E5_OSTTA|nr:Mak16 protein [Ostreococcus tauri]CEG00958.1 Mak16 protein [Ostreococcus tauri]|eukprot:XP_022840698.1 Mak16 protein [Ostreococcus tauri]
MQSDEVVWQIINHGHCSYKVTTDSSNFCKNGFNLTGLCNRSSCPLANSQYATVLEENGELSLYTKTVERSHTPAKLWERTRLSVKYDEALEQISRSLNLWPKFLVHKSKQRLTKLTQLLIRSRKLNKVARQKVETIPAGHAQRDARAERKAQIAARLDTSVEKALLERLKSGVYESTYQFSTSKYAPLFEETISASAERSESPNVKKRRRRQKEIEYEQVRSLM